MFPPLIITTRDKFENEIAKRSMEACEEIANEMGAEIHDDLMQALAVFSLDLNMLERSSNQLNKDEIELWVAKMRNDFQAMTASVRRISRRMMPIGTEGEKFARSVELLCNDLKLPSQGLVHFTNSGHETDIPILSKQYLLRILQELIHNAFKHSSAWHVWVRLNWTEKFLSVEVEDDGTSFVNMNEKISLLNKKYNTLKLRSRAINATLSYHHGNKGLLAKIKLNLN